MRLTQFRPCVCDSQGAQIPNLTVLVSSVIPMYDQIWQLVQLVQPFKMLGYLYMLQRISVNIPSMLENVGLCSWPFLVVWLFGFMVALHPLTKSGNKLELTVFLFQDSMPDLHSHFQYNDIQTHMYASQWFLTLFTAKFPLPMVYRIMDLFLCYVSQQLVYKNKQKPRNQVVARNCTKVTLFTDQAVNT